MKYNSYTLNNFWDIPQLKQRLSDKEIRDIQVVGNVLPFRVNNYIINELIDWGNIPNCPIFKQTFPQKGMLTKNDFNIVDSALENNLNSDTIDSLISKIRMNLNPHPSEQKKNIPIYNGKRLNGIQHKYKETVLFFPSNCQTCHAYCTYCFRWPQFIGIDKFKFAMAEIALLVEYIKKHEGVSDVLFTGGDPMIMKAKNLLNYIEPIINNKIPHLQNIRIGTKSLSYWPYRFTSDNDADKLLKIFEKIVNQGYHLSIMAHFSHPRELKTKVVKKAIRRILNTGAVIRTQSPIVRHINESPDIWSEMWKEQVKLGCVPYYMFIPRDTGTKDYFAVPLIRALDVYQKAYQKVSGIARTARGPIMSADPGKIQILGVTKTNRKKVFVLTFIQGRNPNWVGKVFFSKHNKYAVWLDDLIPLDNNKKFFFEDSDVEENIPISPIPGPHGGIF